MKLSRRAQLINPSLTLSVTARAKEMKRQGLDVISFGAGEPDFDTMQNIKDAAKKAIDDGFTKYTPTSGIMELKVAIAAKLRRDNWLDYDPTQILVSTGGKQALFNAIMTLVDFNDEVIIPLPYWVSYQEMVKLAGGSCAFIKTKDFKITGEDLERAITEKTKVFILNSPGNPTGAVYSEKELKILASICVKKNIFIISDEVYEKIVYDKKHISIASINEKIKALTVVINGVSKTYAMTGWRVGYAAANTEIIKAASRLQDHSTSNACSIAQKAALEAITGPQDHIPKMIYEYRKRRDYMIGKLNSISGIKASLPDGAFYVFADISGLYGGEINGSLKFCEKLLNEAYVAVIPGIAFGDDHSVRFSFATGMANIQRGLERIEKFCGKLKK